jgi:hypothetical protein
MTPTAIAICTALTADTSADAASRSSAASTMGPRWRQSALTASRPCVRAAGFVAPAAHPVSRYRTVASSCSRVAPYLLAACSTKLFTPSYGVGNCSDVRTTAEQVAWSEAMKSDD